MNARELTDRLRGILETLQPGDDSNPEADALKARVEQALAEAEAVPTMPSAEGFLHLPGEGGGEASTEARDLVMREREQMRASILALQQERDVLRERIRQLEEQLNAATRDAPSDGEKNEPLAVPTERAVEITFEAHDPAGHKRRMGDILVEAGILSSEQLESLLAEQSGGKHKRLGALLVERGITSEEMIAKVLAAQLKLPFVDLSAFEIVEAAALQLSGELARRHECIPIDGDLSRITLAMSNPLDLLAIENVELSCNRKAAPAVATPSAITAAIERIYGQRP
ncbi:MAG: hypothetical protein RLZZ303_1692 [Candidatus Hydrogenedentota bacterium]|jgi:hypothetical protein